MILVPFAKKDKIIYVCLTVYLYLDSEEIYQRKNQRLFGL